MNRTIFGLLAISLSSTLAACGGDEPAKEESSALALDGTYRPTEAGAIGSITFANGKDYYLVPSGCTGADCVDIGTYRLDAQARTIVLRNGGTGREATIELEVLKTSDAAAALVKTFVGARDFLDPGSQLVNRGQQTTGGQGQVSGDGQGQLNEGGQHGLAEKMVDLFKTIVEAIMDKQKMKKDDDKKDEDEDEDEKDDEDEKRNDELDCKQGVPTNESTPAEKLAYVARCPNGP